MSWIRERAAAVLAGSAIGDALGGATEGFSPEQIQQRYGGRVTGIVPPYFADWQTHRPISPYHKGDGHITDDTLMTQALVQIYAARRDHLDAYSFSEELIPLLETQFRWVPELEREAILLHRVFLPEKWIVSRIKVGHVDPREAGVGNAVNCGAAMYMAPTGVVNAGNPRAAYIEAIDIAGAHQASYGREAAGVFAASVAAALAPGATVDSVVEATISLAHDGTKLALQAVVDAARALPDTATDDEIGEALRDAIRPFDTVGEKYREPHLDARIPSRTKSIEEFPIALGMLVAHKGDFRKTVLGSINYGRDADSIASMAGAIAAGLGGNEVIDQNWLSDIATASRMDFDHYADMLATVAEEIIDADLARTHADLDRLNALARVPAGVE
ncbi:MULTISPECIES: ADP-ribosylglycohydrolase family protein [Microbacterium]|uniref:ADP-ribosylglycohydrolase family protein n=1 Tax=Microbacterium TaxID=33882 RepID=UPI00277D17B2|nr:MULTISPECIES: ADP-ribosylglycohydrolase family protein [Microbacterium]MDQ1082664.1 ADP-ribosylglycohydrolase [Microbacterium sp. SORGH_AS_0344]MDQ1168564.1 ADP-ribosylglycohydrolase [Microbacterium proteolyticum]